MPAHRRQVRIPTDLCVKMGVQVNETRRDCMSLRVNLFLATTLDYANGSDSISIDSDICFDRLTACTIYYRSIPYHKIMSHTCLLSLQRFMGLLYSHRP